MKKNIYIFVHSVGVAEIRVLEKSYRNEHQHLVACGHKNVSWWEAHSKFCINMGHLAEYEASNSGAALAEPKM